MNFEDIKVGDEVMIDFDTPGYRYQSFWLPRKVVSTTPKRFTVDTWGDGDKRFFYTYSKKDGARVGRYSGGCRSTQEQDSELPQYERANAQSKVSNTMWDVGDQLQRGRGNDMQAETLSEAINTLLYLQELIQE